MRAIPVAPKRWPLTIAGSARIVQRSLLLQLFSDIYMTTRTVCPGKYKRADLNDAEMSETDYPLDVKSPRALDSTFELESSDENESQNEENSHSLFVLTYWWF